MALITKLIIAALSRLVGEEIVAWSPRITDALVRRAVTWLPEKQRARYAEEWSSHINETPGAVGRFLVAVGFLLAALNIRSSAQLGRGPKGGLEILLRLRSAANQLTAVADVIAVHRSQRIRSFDEQQLLMSMEDDLQYGVSRTKGIGDRLEALVSTDPTSIFANLVYRVRIYQTLRKAAHELQIINDFSEGLQRLHDDISRKGNTTNSTKKPTCDGGRSG